MRGQDPSASFLWYLPIYWLTHSGLYVNCVSKIQSASSNSNLSHVKHISLMVVGKKAQITAIVIIFCLIPYGFVSQFTGKTGYNY